MTFAFLRHLSKIGHDYSDNISIVLFFKKGPVGTDRIITVQHCLPHWYIGEDMVGWGRAL